MSQPAERDVGASPDFSVLTADERRALELLARGHTVKSIADLTGRTESAVNERLRSARRKCGVGSSRELARLLDLQKTWDAGNRGGEGPARDTSVQPPDRRKRARPAITVGALLMIVAVAATLLLLQPDAKPSPPAPLNDPMAAAVMGDREPPNLHEMHAKVRAEPRDEAWASVREARLRAAYAKVAGSAGVQNLRVICGSSLCEVAGAIPPRRPAVMQALQEKELGRLAAEAGLADLVQMFGPSPTGGRGAGFVAYWRRAGTERS